MHLLQSHINVTFIRYNITAWQYTTACHQHANRHSLNAVQKIRSLGALHMVMLLYASTNLLHHSQSMLGIAWHWLSHTLIGMTEAVSLSRWLPLACSFSEMVAKGFRAWLLRLPVLQQTPCCTFLAQVGQGLVHVLQLS